MSDLGPSGKKIAIFGFGLEGFATAKYLFKNNHIKVFDEKPASQIDQDCLKFLNEKKISYSFGDVPANKNFDILVHSAGVRRDNPRVQAFKKNGAVITTATQMFFDNCPAKIIGVTGTKGKGTTSTLIYKFIKESGKKVFLAGNIGTPMLEILQQVTPDSLVVLELSSFQLSGLNKSPHIAVVLMITSEHMDWHLNQREYLDAKANIVKHQKESDFAVINGDFENSKNFANLTKAQKYFVSLNSQTNGAYLEEDKIVSNIKNKETICKTSEVLLPGRHNLQNVLASLCVAKLLNVNNQIIKKVATAFAGLTHRLELVSNINGVEYYNDSFSTTPETTIAAIEAFTKPKIIILGGSSKKSDFSHLAEKISSDSTVKKIILIGAEATRIQDDLIKSGAGFKIANDKPSTMPEILDMASCEAKKGDIVLLSPACASFDMFANYKDRGDQFRQEVKKRAGAK